VAESRGNFFEMELSPSGASSNPRRRKFN